MRANETLRNFWNRHMSDLDIVVADENLFIVLDLDGEELEQFEAVNEAIEFVLNYDYRLLECL